MRKVGIAAESRGCGIRIGRVVDGHGIHGIRCGQGRGRSREALVRRGGHSLGSAATRGPVGVHRGARGRHQTERPGHVFEPGLEAIQRRHRRLRGTRRPGTLGMDLSVRLPLDGWADGWCLGHGFGGSGLGRGDRVGNSGVGNSGFGNSGFGNSGFGFASLGNGGFGNVLAGGCGDSDVGDPDGGDFLLRRFR